MRRADRGLMLLGRMLDAGSPFSRSFSYANAGATADKAIADAKAIVTIFTVHLRFCLQAGFLADAACDANSRHTQGVPHHKIWCFVHANVMENSARKKNRWQSTIQQARLDEMIDSRRIGILESKLAMRKTPADVVILIYASFSNDRGDQINLN